MRSGWPGRSGGSPRCMRSLPWIARWTAGCKWTSPNRRSWGPASTPAADEAGGRESVVRVGIVVEGDPDLLEVVRATDPACRLAGGLHRRQQQRDQDAIACPPSIDLPPKGEAAIQSPRRVKFPPNTVSIGTIKPGNRDQGRSDSEGPGPSQGRAGAISSAASFGTPNWRANATRSEGPKIQPAASPEMAPSRRAIGRPV